MYSERVRGVRGTGSPGSQLTVATDGRPAGSSNIDIKTSYTRIKTHTHSSRLLALVKGTVLRLRCEVGDESKKQVRMKGELRGQREGLHQ